MSSPIDILTPPETPAKGRREFALTDWIWKFMLVVMGYGVLMALILPSIGGGGPRSAPTAQVQTEIRGLESAIAQFKSLYGIDPPSRIRLYESTEGSPSWKSHTGTFEDPQTGEKVSHDAERERSVAFLQRIWPNFDFKLAYDLNSDGDTHDVVSLHGAECLVFFLGGMPSRSGSSYTMTGFSKNPTTPFATAADISEPRDGPFFEFKVSRLRPSLNPTALGFAVYMDPLPNQTAPYVYASRYEGRGYQQADLFVSSEQSLKDIYRMGTAPGSPPQKDKNFQIVSPGMDGAYGSGGPFDPTTTTTNHLLLDRRDDDNITNFSPGLMNRSR